MYIYIYYHHLGPRAFNKAGSAMTCMATSPLLPAAAALQTSGTRSPVTQSAAQPCCKSSISVSQCQPRTDTATMVD